MKKTPTLLVLIGNCGSGKTTYANMLVAMDDAPEGRWVKVGRDDFRKLLSNNFNNHDYEDHVTQLVNFTIVNSLRKGYNVVVDNTNLKESYRTELFELAKSVGNVTYEEKVFREPLEVCIERNAKREKVVPEDVLHKFAKIGSKVLAEGYVPRKEYIPRLEPAACVSSQDKSLHKAIIVDIDGTVAIHNGRSPYDTARCEEDLPNEPVVRLVEMYRDQGFDIIFVSGRDSAFEEQTRKWLDLHFTHPYDFEEAPYHLFMRPEGDRRKDQVVKKEIYNQFIKGKWYIDFVVDDRPRVIRMFRYELGLTVFQLNDQEF